MYEKKTSIVPYFTLLTYYCGKLRKITNLSQQEYALYYTLMKHAFFL